MLVLYLPALHDHLEMDPLGLVAQLAYLATGGLAGASIRKASRRLASAGQRKRMEREKRSVRLLIAIVLLFFLCHTGGLIIRIVDLRQHGNEPCFVFAKDL
uniref:Uncharacterized protein n=1 Tax=Meloidogyne javanica TaxID=6303 RepID=A0A915N8U9_MELJA